MDLILEKLLKILFLSIVNEFNLNPNNIIIVSEKDADLASSNLDNCFPVEPLHISAFLLDRSQLKIDINRHLTKNRSSKESILFDMIKKLKINHTLQTSATQSCLTTCTSSSSSSSPSTTNTATTTTLYSLLKRNLSIECLKTSISKLKKVRGNVIHKHLLIPVSSVDSIVNKIENYLKLNVTCDDLFQVWKSLYDTYSHLKCLAQIILAIPATSSPSESVL
ncbi:hypothetical protein I4U23_011045 [Adineta vaga]|nr:hypothetical protein I4U23_011045 [Adineta vaga]